LLAVGVSQDVRSELKAMNYEDLINADPVGMLEQKIRQTL